MLLSKATYSAFRLYIVFVNMCSLGIEPTTFALLTQCSNHWATGISAISTISDTVNMQQVKKLNESLFDVDQTGAV